MNWVEEMRAGMQMMKKACKKNKEWTECKKCPFDEICTALMKKATDDGYDYDSYTPENWLEGD